MADHDPRSAETARALLAATEGEFPPAEQEKFGRDLTEDYGDLPNYF